MYRHFKVQSYSQPSLNSTQTVLRIFTRLTDRGRCASVSRSRPDLGFEINFSFSRGQGNINHRRCGVTYEYSKSVKEFLMSLLSIIMVLD